jgi:hypothetical protein
MYHLLTKEAAYGPNLHHMDDFRAAQKLEKELDDAPRKEGRLDPAGAMARRESSTTFMTKSFTAMLRRRSRV